MGSEYKEKKSAARVKATSACSIEALYRRVQLTLYFVRIAQFAGVEVGTSTA